MYDMGISKLRHSGAMKLEALQRSIMCRLQVSMCCLTNSTATVAHPVSRKLTNMTITMIYLQRNTFIIYAYGKHLKQQMP